VKFRHLAFIAVWTVISGPLVGVPSGPGPSSSQLPKVAKIAKPAKSPVKSPARR